MCGMIWLFFFNGDGFQEEIAQFFGLKRMFFREIF